MEAEKQHSFTHQQHHYSRFWVMAVLSYISMYALMYSMVDVWANVVPNINQAYMAAVMTAPMLLIELLVMGSMYKNKKANVLIITGSLVLLIGSFTFIRKQAAVKDRQFLKSMIPHHAGAVLMVEESELTDPEVQQLARNIIESQQKEIEFMKAKLKDMEME
jgi:uncharacterized protein (DUF305 family)